MHGAEAILCRCCCLDQPLDVYLNMNVNDISSISETKMASVHTIHAVFELSEGLGGG